MTESIKQVLIESGYSFIEEHDCIYDHEYSEDKVWYKDYGDHIKLYMHFNDCKKIVNILVEDEHVQKKKIVATFIQEGAPYVPSNIRIDKD